MVRTNGGQNCLQNRHHLFPLRSAALHYGLWIVDLYKFFAQPQTGAQRSGLIGIHFKRWMGFGFCWSCAQCCQIQLLSRSFYRHHLQPDFEKKGHVLSQQSDLPVRSASDFNRFCVLLATRGRRKNLVDHNYSSRPYRLHSNLHREHSADFWSYAASDKVLHGNHGSSGNFSRCVLLGALDLPSKPIDKNVYLFQFCGFQIPCQAPWSEGWIRRSIKRAAKAKMHSSHGWRPLANIFSSSTAHC